MVLRFRNRRFPERANRAAQGLVIQARAIVGDTEDTVVSVSEHDCGEPACAAQTVILVMRANQPTRAVKIKKPLAAVTGADLAAAMAPPAKENQSSEAQSHSTRS